MGYDRISALPDSLITQILLYLPTKDSVKTSLLSTRWRNIWLDVPGLELRSSYIRFSEALTKNIIDRFFNSESRLQKFKVMDNHDRFNIRSDTMKEWIATAIDRGIEHLDFKTENVLYLRYFMPMNIYKSKTLVSLKLAKVRLENPEFVVSLPCLKIMHLKDIFYNLYGLLITEKLILGCPVLEELTLVSNHHYDYYVKAPAPFLRVKSQTLKIFRSTFHPGMRKNIFAVEIDAPGLKYMSFKDDQTDRIVVKNLSSLLKIDTDTNFNVKFAGSPLRTDDLTKRDIISDFLTGISSVRHMIISQRNLEVLFRYSKLEPFPTFLNLSHLQVSFSSSMLQLLPIFLESCPNLKKLIVNFSVSKEPDQQIDLTYVPRCLSSTLDYVEINKLITWEKSGMKLVKYILENSVVLMTLNLSFTNPVEHLDIYEELLTSIKRSRRCRVNLFH